MNAYFDNGQMLNGYFSFDSDNPEEEGEEHISNGTGATGISGAETIQHTTVVSGDTQGGLRTPLEPKDPMLHSNKLEVLKKDQNKKTQSYKVPVSSGVHTDNHNFSQELKRDSEYVSSGCISTSMHY